MSNGVTEKKSRMRVFAVEDNQDFAQVLRHLLEAMGCDLDVAFDARSGLEMAKKAMPHLIFCDIGLPGDMNGFDFARAIRVDTDLAHIPLIAVSGYTSDEDKARAVSAGFDRVFPKPVKFSHINEALTTFSQGKRTK
jgi:CheY-like chemotaxis protein